MTRAYETSPRATAESGHELGDEGLGRRTLRLGDTGHPHLSGRRRRGRPDADHHWRRRDHLGVRAAQRTEGTHRRGRGEHDCVGASDLFESLRGRPARAGTVR